MYDELVKKLRYCGNAVSCLHCPYWGGCGGSKEDLKHAADAIEGLCRRETPMKITEIHVDEYYCPTCGAENNCDQGYVQDNYCPVCGQRICAEPKEET